MAAAFIETLFVRTQFDIGLFLFALSVGLSFAVPAARASANRKLALVICWIATST